MLLPGHVLCRGGWFQPSRPMSPAPVAVTVAVRQEAVLGGSVLCPFTQWEKAGRRARLLTNGILLPTPLPASSFSGINLVFSSVSDGDIRSHHDNKHLNPNC